jgi:plastocyanin
MKAPILLSLFLATTSTHTALAACGPGDFVSRNESQVSVNIDGRGYTPACLKVKAGTAVTIDASRNHPLQGVPNRNGPANPFHRGSEATSPETQALREAGRYDYFCTRHGDANGRGMAGTILVE